MSHEIPWPIRRNAPSHTPPRAACDFIELGSACCIPADSHSEEHALQTSSALEMYCLASDMLQRAVQQRTNILAFGRRVCCRLRVKSKHNIGVAQILQNVALDQERLDPSRLYPIGG